MHFASLLIFSVHRQSFSTQVDTHFLYLLDMYAALCPNIRNGTLLKKIIKMSADIAIVDLPRSSIDVASVIKKFYNLIHDDALLEIVYNPDIEHDIYWSK